MEHLIDKILEAYKLKQEVRSEVPTCDICGLSEPSWHTYGFAPFLEVAKALNGGMFKEEDTGCKPYRWKYYFECRGITVFCLTDDRVEVPS